MGDQPIRLVCFDLGRVLVKICDTWAEASRLMGYEPVVDTEQPGVLEVIRDCVDALERGHIDQPEFAERICALHEDLHTRQVIDVFNAWIRHCFDGVDALLDDLHAAGCATACLSNTNARHWQIMFDRGGAGFEPLARLQHRFGSHEIGARKPEAETYNAVEQGTGLSGGAILFFDDLAENIAAARRHGWRAELVEDRVDPVSQMRGFLASHGVRIGG